MGASCSAPGPTESSPLRDTGDEHAACAICAPSPRRVARERAERKLERALIGTPVLQGCPVPSTGGSPVGEGIGMQMTKPLLVEDDADHSAAPRRTKREGGGLAALVVVLGYQRTYLFPAGLDLTNEVLEKQRVVCK